MPEIYLAWIVLAAAGVTGLVGFAIFLRWLNRRLEK